MTTVPPLTVEGPLAAPPIGRLARVEAVALTIALAAMMILPLLGAPLRLLGTQISGQSSIVQHLVLIAGMLGAAIAAREGRLLSLSTVEQVIKGRWRGAGRSFSAGVAATVCLLLGVAAALFVQSEREGGGTLPYQIPTWLVQLVLPLGFAVIALRILWRASDEWRGRSAAALITALLVFIAVHPPVSPAQLTIPAFILLLLATVLGAPIFTTLGGAGLILFWRDGTTIASVTVDHYSMVTNPTLPTIPLFTLAGYFLAEGGASRRLIRLFRALLGQMRGGPAILVALVCAFFTSFTGASGVTILALGALLMPVLLSAGYSEQTSLGLITGTGSLGLLLPPCLPLIFYAVVASVDIRNMFLGGILPGFLLIILTSIWGISQAPRTAVSGQPFGWREARAAVWDAKWELLIPVIALGALFSGMATPVEAAAATAFYAFIVETIIYKDLRPFADSPRVMAESGVLVGGVLLILGVALGFTDYLALAEVPSHAVEWVRSAVHSKYLFLLLLNLFLLVVGCLMDVYSAIVIVVPLLVPLGRSFGIDPVHLGIIFLANLELGYLTPPVGVNLFLSSLRFNKPMSEVVRAVIPMLLVLLFGVLLITYIPAMTTTLPRLFGRQ